MNTDFINIAPLRYWVQRVLPLVYDDSLSYMELLNKVVYKLNELIENNKLLPDYIANLIKEYISSGAIEKVLAEILADYMLNVKFPPEGLTPATGDGSADDTEAIQGCINYAREHGGMAVYFPSGSYLTQSLTIYNKTTMFGYDRYNTRLVLKGGATQPLITGNSDNLTLIGLGFDGNMDIQVNNVNLIDINVKSAIISNCLLTDGYELLKINVSHDLQIDNIIFDHAVIRGLDILGNGIVEAGSLSFNSVSSLIGADYILINASNSIMEDIHFIGASPLGCQINGDNNIIKFYKGNVVNPYIDNGINNSIEVYTESKQDKVTGNVIKGIGGNYTELIAKNKLETINETKELKASQFNILSPLNISSDSIIINAENLNSEIEEVNNIINKSLNENINAKTTNIIKTYSFNSNAKIEKVKEKIETTTSNLDVHSIDFNGFFDNYNNETTHSINTNSENINFTASDTIFLNSAEPLKYSSVHKINNYFNGVNFKDINNNIYEVLVNSNFLKSLCYKNVLDYNINNNGVDTTENFKIFINNLEDGDIVIIPKGSYLLTESITINKTVKIIGSGINSILNFSNGGLILNSQGIDISGLLFISNNKNSTGLTVYNDFCRINNITFRDDPSGNFYWNNSLHLINTWYTLVSNIQINDYKNSNFKLGTGILFDACVNLCLENIFVGFKENGLKVSTNIIDGHGCDGIQIEQGNIVVCNTGFQINYGSNIIVNNLLMDQIISFCYNIKDFYGLYVSDSYISILSATQPTENARIVTCSNSNHINFNSCSLRGNPIMTAGLAFYNSNNVSISDGDIINTTDAIIFNTNNTNYILNVNNVQFDINGKEIFSNVPTICSNNNMLTNNEPYISLNYCKTFIYTHTVTTSSSYILLDIPFSFSFKPKLIIPTLNNCTSLTSVSLFNDYTTKNGCRIQIFNNNNFNVNDIVKISITCFF